MQTELAVSGTVNENVKAKVTLWNVENIGTLDPRRTAGTADTDTVIVREAKADITLNPTSSVVLGRQNIAMGQGLIVNNSLATQDLINFNWKPGVFNFQFVIGDADNGTAGNTYTGGTVPGISSGAALGTGTVLAGLGVPVALVGAPVPAAGGTIGFITIPAIVSAGALGAGQKLGITTGGRNSGLPANDEMVATRISFPLWDNRIQVGGNWLIDGMAAEEAFSADFAFSLWERAVKIEWAKSGSYDTDADTVGNDDAILINADLIKWGGWKLWGAYANAGDGFQVPTASIANPYVRTYSEALFDRPVAFGSPMLTGPIAGALPIVSDVWQVGLEGPGLGGYWSFGWYTGDANEGIPTATTVTFGPLVIPVAVGGGNLGDVLTIGYTRPLVPGVDLELKYGHASFDNVANQDIDYFRIGSKLSF